MQGLRRDRSDRRSWLRRVAGVGGLLLLGDPSGRAEAAAHRFEPSEFVPMEQIPPGYREQVSEIIRENHFHRKSKSETFPCNGNIYLNLLNHPVLTLGLWHDLSETSAKLRQTGPNRYQGDDGNGTAAVWEFLIRSARLHVLLCTLQYSGPRGKQQLDGRVVLVVHTGYFQKSKGESWIQHDVEAFVKVDSKGWKTVARVARPVIEKVLEDQIQEAGWFVSLMGRLVEMYPSWACEATLKQSQVPAEIRQTFHELVESNKRPNAMAGRPKMIDEVMATTTGGPANASGGGTVTR